MTAKKGRPTNNPKTERITVRLDQESQTVLKEYCEEHQVEKGEAVRRGIKKLKSEK